MNDTTKFFVISAGEEVIVEPEKGKSYTWTSRRKVNGLVRDAKNEKMAVMSSSGAQRVITVAEFLVHRPSLVA